MIYLKQADSWCERLPLSGTCGVCESILFYIEFHQQLHENITPECWSTGTCERQLVAQISLYDDVEKH